MNDITELFDSLLSQSDSIDMADSDFRRMLLDDPALKRAYRQWCAEQGTSERLGFADYCREYIERREGGWNIFQADDHEEI